MISEEEPTTESSPDWLRIPNDIWCLIFETLPLEDHIRCGSVCTRWYSILRELKRCSSLPRVPWLVLHDDGSSLVSFFDVASNKMHKSILPELIDHSILGSSEGWLIVVDKNTADIRLFNPFTKDEKQLPPTSTFPGIKNVYCDSQGHIKKYSILSGLSWEPVLRKHKATFISQRYFRKGILTSSKCGYIVIVKYRDIQRFGKDGVAFARAGDKTWTDLHLSTPTGRLQCQSGMFLEDLFYAMLSDGSVLSFDLQSNLSPPPHQLVAPPVPDYDRNVAFLGVLPGSRELLHVHWSFSQEDLVLKTFRLDRKAGEWINMSSSLDGHSVFGIWGFSSPQRIVCLPSKVLPQIIKRNCMYLIHDGAVVRDGSVEVWDMEDQKLEPCVWTPQSGRERGNCVAWIEPVLSSLDLPGTQG